MSSQDDDQRTAKLDVPDVPSQATVLTVILLHIEVIYSVVLRIYRHFL